MAGTGVVLILAAGADWEPAVLAAIEGRRDLAVLRRCMDVEELLAAAAAGQADAAVVGTDAPGLDARAVELLARHGVRTVGIVPAGAGEEQARARAMRAGIARIVGQAALASLPAALLADDTAAASRLVVPEQVSAPEPAAAPGRVLTVWGGAGGPGRTTVAAAVAAELARRREVALLVDADPYGGSVAQQLGILDEVSGLLAAARLASSGSLATGLAGVVRMLDSHLGVITGLPRPDRWAEVRGEALEELVAAAARTGTVVLDSGFSIEEDGLDARPGRNQLTVAALDLADEVVVVGTADPVGLTRLARGLVDLRERDPGKPLRVVVNRMRPSLGWSERDVADMIAGVGGHVPIHFLPEDRASVDKALVTGRTLLETAPDGPLPRAVRGLVDALVDAPVAVPAR